MQKRRIIALLLVMVMCISLCACGGGSDNEPKEVKGDITDELVSEKWCESESGETVLQFYKTGTGRLESPSTKLDFVWNILEDYENCVRFEFDYMDAHHTNDFELVEEDGVIMLQHLGDGVDYVRVSDFE